MHWSKLGFKINSDLIQCLRGDHKSVVERTSALERALECTGFLLSGIVAVGSPVMFCRTLNA